MRLEVITPEFNVFSGEVSAVLLPGIDGLFQILNNHAPIISALKAGSIKVDLVESFEADEKTSSLFLKCSTIASLNSIRFKLNILKKLKHKRKKGKARFPMVPLKALSDQV